MLNLDFYFLFFQDVESEAGLVAGAGVSRQKPPDTLNLVTVNSDPPGQQQFPVSSIIYIYVYEKHIA